MPGTIVLVVDDDAALRLLCRVNLELDGHLVHEAATLAAARDVLAVEPVDVLLLDVHVGSENGIAFLHELRENRASVSVALFTGSATLARAERLLADGVLPKPFELEQLSETVRSLAALRQSPVTVQPR